MKRGYILVFIGLVILVSVFLFLRNGNHTREKATSLISDVPVNATRALRQTLTNQISLVGTINANNDVNVVSETQGVVREVFVKVGDQVKSGVVLVRVDDEIPRSNLATASINYEKAKRDFERTEALYQENSISVSQLDAARLGLKAAENQLDIARRQMENTKIKSPIAGTVNARSVNVGTMVVQGATVANVVDITTLKVRVNVTEREAFQLKPGDKVDVSTDVYPGVTFTGLIDNIGSKADEAHTYAVEILLRNSAEHALKAGMFARVSFVSIQPKATLAIPREALVGSSKNAEVFVVRAGVVDRRSIVVGRQTAVALEVLQGLEEGDSVVTSGHSNLVDRSRVIVLSSEERQP
jgi:RND family efflux transporter MFP subunit